jgi:hypothetical protein
MELSQSFFGGIMELSQKFFFGGLWNFPKSFFLGDYGTFPKVVFSPFILMINIPS